jgi:hypothetical protein
LEQVSVKGNIGTAVRSKHHARRRIGNPLKTFCHADQWETVLTVDAAMKQLRASAQTAFAAEEKLIGILKREGLLK